MGTPPEDWGLEAIRERMNVFVAVRGLGECSVGDPVVLPNLMRGVLGCLSLERIAEVDARMFIGPDVEVTGDLLPGLMGGR